MSRRCVALRLRSQYSGERGRSCSKGDDISGSCVRSSVDLRNQELGLQDHRFFRFKKSRTRASGPSILSPKKNSPSPACTHTNNLQVMHNSSPRVGSSQKSEASFKRKRGVFQKDLEHMMYRFGDDPNPLPETVALVEDIVVEYVTDLVHKAQDIASKRGKLLTEDFLYLIRKDLPKLYRCTELLSMHEELKQARKAFDVSEETLANAD